MYRPSSRSAAAAAGGVAANDDTTAAQAASYAREAMLLLLLFDLHADAEGALSRAHHHHVFIDDDTAARSIRRLEARLENALRKQARARATLDHTREEAARAERAYYRAAAATVLRALRASDCINYSLGAHQQRAKTKVLNR
jgi:hypothetical protein